MSTKTRIDILAILGYSTHLISILYKDVNQNSTFANLFLLSGSIFVVFASALYAEYKGYSKWFGLLGLLNLPGLYILTILQPNELKRPAAHIQQPKPVVTQTPNEKLQNDQLNT